jgi:hypothetical protein
VTSDERVQRSKLVAHMGIFDKDGHVLALDSRNDHYVSEVTGTFAVNRGRAPADCHTFQKFSLN